MANEVARRLRKSMTRQEVKLWVHLRSWRARGYHFRRQAPCIGYIVDFMCLRARLVIEVDGGQHNSGREAANDRLRDQRLVAAGFRVLRYWNNEVDGNLEGVLEDIDRVLRIQRPTPSLLREAGEGGPPQRSEGGSGGGSFREPGVCGQNPTRLAALATLPLHGRDKL